MEEGEEGGLMGRYNDEDGKEEHEIEGEKAYPIYSVRIEYTHDINDENMKYIGKNQILPNSRAKGYISYSQMYKKEQDINEIKQEVNEKTWVNFIKVHDRRTLEEGRIPIDKPTLESIDISLLRYETWSLTRFSHWTFDDGRSNIQYVESFARFVARMKQVEGYCLMGAEDVWRWHGKSDDDKERTDPPCRCMHCKNKGIVRIDH